MTLDPDEIATIHDVVVCGSECPVHLTAEQCEALVREAPDGLKASAAAWTWSDSCVRDELAVWLNTEHGAWALNWVGGRYA